MPTDKPATITVKQTTVDNLIDQLAQSKLDEALLAALLFGDEHDAGKGFREIAAEMRTLIGHLDAIIAAYQQDGLGPIINAVRVAKEWRGARHKAEGGPK